LLDADVVENDQLPLSTRIVGGEDPRAARIRAGLARGEPVAELLAAEHVGYVVEQLDQPDVDGLRGDLDDLPLIWRGGSLALRSVPGSTPAASHRHAPVGVALGGLTLAATTGAVLLPRFRSRWYARRN
jgi:hypothetical protein